MSNRIEGLAVRGSRKPISILGVLIALAGAALRLTAAELPPPQEVHREGFVAAGEELFALVTQFYAFDEALPLATRSVDRWEDGGARFETIVFTTSSGERVPGDLALPAAGDPPYPAVLLVHGLGSSRDRWWQEDREALPRGLLEAGIAVLTLDLRFHGARGATNDYQSPVYLTFDPRADDPSSHGSALFIRSRDMTIQSTIDCRRALDVLGERDDIDASRIAVAGYSMGAMIAVYLAALEPELLAVAAAAIPTREQELPSDHFNFAPRAQAPVLLQMGRGDWLSSPADGETLRGLFPAGTAELRLYDAGHRLPPAFAADAAAWLRGKLR